MGKLAGCRGGGYRRWGGGGFGCGEGGVSSEGGEEVGEEGAVSWHFGGLFKGGLGIVGRGVV